MTLIPHALDIVKPRDGNLIAIVADYHEFERRKTLPIVYLVRLDHLNNMIFVDNYTLYCDEQEFIQGQYVFTNDFDYVISVSIHDSTQQVLVGIPQLHTTYLFAFNSTNLLLVNQFDHPARSLSWLDNDGLQASLLLSDIATSPWAQSRVQVINVMSIYILYAYANNQQTLEPRSRTLSKFIRLTTTYDHRLVILTIDGNLLLVPSADAGYYRKTDDIDVPLKTPAVCPNGTFKSTRDTTPCTICLPGTRSSPISKICFV